MQCAFQHCRVEEVGVADEQAPRLVMFSCTIHAVVTDNTGTSIIWLGLTIMAYMTFTFSTSREVRNDIHTPKCQSSSETVVQRFQTKCSLTSPVHIQTPRTSQGAEHTHMSDTWQHLSVQVQMLQRSSQQFATPCIACGQSPVCEKGEVNATQPPLRYELIETPCCRAPAARDES